MCCCPLVLSNQASWYEYHPSTPSGSDQGRMRGYSYQRDCFQTGYARVLSVSKLRAQRLSV